MLFKVPIILHSSSQYQANYAHHFVSIVLSQFIVFCRLIHDNSLVNSLFMIKALFHSMTIHTTVLGTDKLQLH